MIPRVLVLPFDNNLVFRLGADQKIVPKISELTDIQRVRDTAGSAGSDLHCIEINTGVPLSILDFSEDWGDIPLALHVSGLGRLPELAVKMNGLRQLNVRIYLPVGTRENLIATRILSSLGFETALILTENGTDWEELSDLMTYALLGRAPHAPIAPFNYAADIYTPNQLTDFSKVYFDDPTIYLHVDIEGRVALTRRDLNEGRYIVERVEDLGNLEENERYRDHLEQWREVFLQKDGCAYCPGWRVCLGKFDHGGEGNEGCSRLFSDFMDTIEQYQEIKKQEKKLWQF